MHCLQYINSRGFGVSIGTKIKLDICIPTFQRSNECLRQASFLLNEIKSLKDYRDCEIKIYIRDNNSSEEDYAAIIDGIEKLRYEGFNIVVNRNNENFGLIGNIKKMLLDDSSGDYVWFVGDDDILFNGILDKVVCNLADKKDLFFMNYNCIHKEFGLVRPHAFDRNESTNIIELFKNNDAIMMFITSCIYSREKIISAVSFHEKNHGTLEITFPLYSAFYCSLKGTVKIIPDIYMSDVVSGISWESVYNKVRLVLVPREILKLNALGYPKYKTYHCLINYFGKNYRYIIGVILRLFISTDFVNKMSRYFKASS